MYAESWFDDGGAGLAAVQARLVRAAVGLSLLLHVVAFLTSPWWQPRPADIPDVIEVDIGEMPQSTLPEVPEVKVSVPPAVPKPPPRPATRTDAAGPLEAVPPPSREAIRQRVAQQSPGILKMLSGARDDASGGDPLSAIRIPKEIRTSRGPARPGDYAPQGGGTAEAVGIRAPVPTIAKQVAAAPRSSTALSSQVFRTDAGLEGEISGPVDDPVRSSQSITATVRQYQSGIRYAYNKELLANPDISGKITVAFVIAADGSVESVEIRQSSVGWPPLEEAVRKRMLHWKFPKARGGGPVRVVFPFVFQPEM